jgi:PAS domain S-box-containing protein
MASAFDDFQQFEEKLKQHQDIITEYQRTHEELKLSAQQFIELANAMPQLVWIARADGTVIYYNNRVGEFAGASVREDGSWYWEGLLHPEDREITAVAWQNALQGRSAYQIEHRVQLQGGVYRWYLSRAVPYYDGNGEIIKWFGTATDIHDSKTLSEVLEEKVAERTFQYEVLNRQLQHSNEDLLRFAHIASHDMKEPLRKIRLFGKMFLELYGEHVPEEGRKLLDKVVNSSARLDSLVDGILNYSMVDMEESDITSCNLELIIKDVIWDLELVIKDKQAIVHVESLPVIKGKQIYLHQLFYNLMINSLKFSAQGKIPNILVKQIPFTSRDSKHLEPELQDQYCKISFSDNGIGFEVAYAEKIFGVLERLHSREIYDGTGLGLALCRKIVGRHGGFIYADAEAGRGSEFIVILPYDNTINRRKRSSGL